MFAVSKMHNIYSNKIGLAVLFINILFNPDAYAGEYPHNKFGIYIHDGYGQNIIDRASNMGANFTYVNIFWGEVETKQDAWEWKIADSKILPKIKSGIETGVKLISSNQWGTEPVPLLRKITRRKERALRDSASPKDLNPEWNNEYGHSKDYYDFVYTIVKKYGDKVKYWAVENEITYRMNFTGELQAYKLLLPTAYKAIKDANPDALVLNHGPSSVSYGEAIAFELFMFGKEKEALNFYNTYLFPQRREKVKNTRELKKIFKKDLVQKKYGIIMDGFENSKNYDIYQLHYYDKADMLDLVLEWIKNKKKKYFNNKPISCWEAGYYWKKNPTYNKEDHAIDIFKKVIILLANDVGIINYHSIFGKSEKGDPWRGLYVNFSGKEKRPACYVYENLIKLLKNAEFKKASKLNDGSYVYRFGTENKEIYFVWSNTDKGFSLPDSLKNAAGYDIYGHPFKLREDKTIVSKTPIYFVVNID